MFRVVERKRERHIYENSTRNCMKNDITRLTIVAQRSSAHWRIFDANFVRPERYER